MSDFQVVMRDPKTLIPAEYNPRKLSAKQKQDLRASLTRFGFVDPVLVNMHPERENILIGGHQRVTVAIEMGMALVPCHELSLTLDKEKELNIRLNKNGGEWDMEALDQFFGGEELLSFGFEAWELPAEIEPLEAGPEGGSLEGGASGVRKALIIDVPIESYGAIEKEYAAFKASKHQDVSAALLEFFKACKGASL